MSTSIVNIRGSVQLPQISRSFPTRRSTPLELALRDLAQGRYEEAISRFDVLLADPALDTPERALAANKRGVAFIRIERIDEARAAFEQALSSSPATHLRS